VRLWPLRKRDEPPGIWRGRPRVGSRWRFGGITRVLVTYSVELSGSVRLEYMEEAEYRARYWLPSEDGPRPWWRPRKRSRQHERMS